MYMYELDAELSTDEKPMVKDCIFSSEFTISDTVKFEELTSAHKNSMQRTATSIARQFLDFRFNAGKSLKEKIYINIHLDYASASKQWKEKSLQAKSVDCEKCKLEDVILDTETKEDILRTINFVKNMKDYLEIGCKLPSGILLEGPPGTGKTLISKTIASEGKMNFTSVVGSDLVQKYVGESAKKVAAIFDELIKKGGGVLFIDEIDAIGAKRESSEDNKEYRACLNKLLACMSDAAENNIIVIGATNIAEQLDPALIREGRIDQIINVPLPNYDSRVELFKLYIGKLKHEDDMDYAELAEKTEGKSGAFIASVCNHSGMYAVDQGCKKVKYEHVLHSVEKMLRDNKEKDNKKPIGFLLK
jgi:ATP-dependent 26S proteasome regulatory subunit